MSAGPNHSRRQPLRECRHGRLASSGTAKIARSPGTKPRASVLTHNSSSGFETRGGTPPAAAVGMNVREFSWGVDFQSREANRQRSGLWQNCRVRPVEGRPTDPRPPREPCPAESEPSAGLLFASGAHCRSRISRRRRWSSSNADCLIATASAPRDRAPRPSRDIRRGYA